MSKTSQTYNPRLSAASLWENSSGPVCRASHPNHGRGARESRNDAVFYKEIVWLQAFRPAISEKCPHPSNFRTSTALQRKNWGGQKTVCVPPVSDTESHDYHREGSRLGSIRRNSRQHILASLEALKPARIPRDWRDSCYLMRTDVYMPKRQVGRERMISPDKFRQNTTRGRFTAEFGPAKNTQSRRSQCNSG
jgi:hypothetical protein